MSTFTCAVGMKISGTGSGLRPDMPDVLATGIVVVYMLSTPMSTPLTERELKRSSATLLVLSLVAETPRHGYDIGKLIEQRSQGAIAFQMASFYPLLYRLEKRGWITGRWQGKAGERRRRFYRITAEGRKVLESERGVWQVFLGALDRVTGLL